MTIVLTPSQEEIINRKIAEGNFADPAQVIDAALSLFLEQEDGSPPDELRRELARADAQFAAGQFRTLTINQLPALFEEIKARGDQRIAERQKRATARARIPMRNRGAACPK